MTTTEERTVIHVQEDMLEVHGYRTDDTAIVGRFKRLADEERPTEFDRFVQLGFRVAEMARPALDIDFVRHEFDDSVRRQKAILDEGRQLLLKDAVGALGPMFGPEGSLPTTLRNVVRDIEGELSKYLDEGSTKSISEAVGKRVDEALQAGERRMRISLESALDLSDDGRGLGRLYKALRTENQSLNSQLVDLITHVSALVARKAEREGSAKKGDDFEQSVFLEVARIAGLNGDSAERTGTLNGESARKRGDIVVMLDSALTPADDVRFTLEAMDRRSGSLRSVLTELDQAKANRAARAAIGVLSSREAPCSNGLPLQRFPGNRFLVVVDKESWDLLALEVAYTLARFECLKASDSGNRGDIDLKSASEHLDQAVAHLSDLDRLRAKLGISRGGLRDAESIIAELEAKLTDSLSRVSALLVHGADKA